MESREDEGRLGSEKKIAEREGAEGGREGEKFIVSFGWRDWMKDIGLRKEG